MKRRIISAVLAAIMIVNAFPMEVLSDDICTHPSTEKVTLQENICDHYGKGEVVLCSLCNEVVRFESWQGECPLLEDLDTQYDLAAHKLTITVDGEEGRCSDTKAFDTRTGEQYQDHEHSYVPTLVIGPTCTSIGYTQYTCQGCGDTYSDDIEAALDHDWQLSGHSDGTCQIKGYDEYTCSRCNETKREETGEEPSGHDYVFDQIVEPSCLHRGYEVYICSKCEEELHTNFVPTVGHNYVPMQYENGNAGNYDPAEVHYEVCSVCGDVLEGENHEYIFPPFMKAPTCLEDGYIEYECKVCGYTVREEIPKADDHDWHVVSTTMPDCLYKGEIVYECSYCHEQKTEELPIDVNAHQWISDPNFESPNKVTCTTAGLVGYVCDVCGKKKTEEVIAFGHDYGNWTVVIDATCTTAGEEQRICANDPAHVETRTIDPLGHSYGDDHKCSRCGMLLPEIQEIIDDTALLPDPDPSIVTPGNAQAILNDVNAVLAKIDAINNGLDDDVKEALGLYTVDEQLKLADLKALCESYKNVTNFSYKTGEVEFTLLFNDNQKKDRIVTEDNILELCDPVLNYEIVASDGTVIDSGTLATPNDANAAFNFLFEGKKDENGDPWKLTKDLVEVEYNDGPYVFNTESSLPVSYKATTIDYTTLESHTEEYSIRYSITLKNPDPDNYVYTLPDVTDDRVELAADEEAILTEMLHWDADVVWNDDSNRSAHGNGDTDRPRIDAETLTESATVYMYPQGYNIPTGELVTSDFQIVLGETVGNTTHMNLTGLPAYDNDGNPLSYYVEFNKVNAANEAVVPGNHYVPSYLNNGNYASKTNGVYNGGFLFETLENTLTFDVTKIWEDELTPEERLALNSKFFIWRITENYDSTTGDLDINPATSFAIPRTMDYYSVPTEDESTFDFYTVGGGYSSYVFPMYDNQGRRYIYFGTEAKPNGYKVTIDNSTSLAADAVIGVFDESYEDYFLSGSTITNSKNPDIPLSLNKEFRALSLQNLLDSTTPITASFLLQIYDETQGKWVAADVVNDSITMNEQAGVELDVAADNSLTVTLTNFTAEDMSDSYSGLSYKELDSNNQHREFRWVETSVSINGVSASYDPAKWELTPTGLVYTGDIIVNDGQTSTVLGDASNKTSAPDDTTALFTAVYDNESNLFTNTLIGDHQVEIIKTWYDADGNSIGADKAIVGDLSVKFKVYRDDEEIQTVELTYDDLVPGTDIWEEILNLDRYDAEGREYRYTVEEVNDGGDWIHSSNYTVSVVEYPADSDILLKRTVCEYGNHMGPGTILEFEVSKEWLDDSDLVTRNPIEVKVFRFRNIDNTLLETPVEVASTEILNESNNWFHKYLISAEAGDSVHNYVIVETGTYVGGVFLPVRDAKGNDVTSFTSAQLQAISEGSLNSTYEYGILGSDADTGDHWDGLEYKYRVFDDFYLRDGSSTYAVYKVTNLRIGFQNFAMNKLWKSGNEVRKSSFGIFLQTEDGRVEVGRYTVSPTDNADAWADTNIEIVWTDAAKDQNGDLLPQYQDVAISVTSSLNEKGNHLATVLVEGFPKFDELGCQLNYVIDEVVIFDIYGDPHEVTGSSVTLEGITYSISRSVTAEYAPSTDHRSPDLYYFDITNIPSNNYDLISNKVWRDDNGSIRPDISFTMYRASTADPELRALVDDVTSNGGSDALAAYLAGFVDKNHLVMTDRYWDTRINEFWWTCRIDDVPQFDADGYPYVYFGVEYMPVGSVNVGGTVHKNHDYEGYYCNDTYALMGDAYRPNNPAVADDELLTEDVFAKDNDELTAMARSVFILGDGIHTGKDGTYATYYSATAVNRPEAERTIEGNKLWKMPLNWVVDQGSMPAIRVDLYRTTEEISSTSFDDPKDFVDAIKAAAVPLEGHTELCMNSAIAEFDPARGNYYYFFEEDSDGHTLQRYDEYGHKYYFYTIEGDEVTSSEDPLEGVGTSTFKVTYDENSFNISNVFSSQPPFVKVNVQKVWTISSELYSKLGNNEIGLDDLEAYDLAPAEITLYGMYLNKDGNPTSPEPSPFLTVTLIPDAAGSYDYDEFDGDDTVITAVSNADGSVTLTATYAFTQFYNDQTEQVEKLPYFWLKNYRVRYSLEEAKINGYQVTISGSYNDIPFDTHTVGENDVWTYENSTANTIIYNNEYVAEEKTFEFFKIWNDNYVDNNDYRPDSLTVEIHRKSGTKGDEKEDSTFALKVTLNKDDFASSNVWKGSVDHLLKYDPQGYEYTYFLYSEMILDKDGNVVTDSEGHELKVTINDSDKTLADYKLTGHTDSSFTNTLVDESKVEVEAQKTWLVDGKEITEFTTPDFQGFDDLRRLGVFPDKVVFLLQRSLDGSAFVNVPGVAVSDDVHTVDVDGKTVLGHEVVLSTATEDTYANLMNAYMIWKQLPKYENTTKQEYSYRVIEVMYWPDGTTTTIVADQSDTAAGSHGVATDFTTSTTADVDVSVDIQNNLTVQKIRIAKVWDDDNGSQNTRPDQITVWIYPKGTAPEDGIELTLTTNGNPTSQSDSNIYYYSDYISISKGIPVTFGAGPAGTNNTGSDTSFWIKEEYTTPDGSVYTEVIDSSADGALVYDAQNDVYTFSMYNNLEVKTKYVDLQAQKTWSDEAGWEEVIRPEMSFKLQYKDQISKQWIDFTDTTIASFTKPGITNHAVLSANEGNKYTVKWDDLKKYWDDPQEDGVAELIQYRVVEILDKGQNTSYEKLNSDVSKNGYKTFSTASANDQNAAKATIKNTPTTTDISVQKVWNGINENNISATLTKNVITTLVSYKMLPEFIRMKVEYSVDNGNTWTVSPCANATKEFKTVELLTEQNFGVSLPRYDKNGNEIMYRVCEDAYKYSGESDWHILNWSTGSSVAVDSMIFTMSEVQTWDGTTLPAFSLTNTYEYISMDITKVWEDEDNRDVKRPTVNVTATRDGVQFISIDFTGNRGINTTNFTGKNVTLKNEGNKWTIHFDYLAKYQKGSSDVLSVYNWKETISTSSGYTVTYDAASDQPYPTRDEMINTREPDRGTIVAYKTWTDMSNAWDSETDTVYFKLQYKDGTEWKDVEHKDMTLNHGIYLYPDGKGVYTTSDEGWHAVQADDIIGTNSWATQWLDLPVNRSLKATTTNEQITYRVIEGKMVDGAIVEINNTDSDLFYGYKVVYSTDSSGTKLTDGATKSPTITNTLQYTTLDVKKIWEGDTTYKDLVRPDSVTFEIEYRKAAAEGETENAWTSIPVGAANVTGITRENGKTYVTVTSSDTNWTKTVTNLPYMDAEGTEYEYRVTEAYISYGSTKVLVATTADGDIVGPYDIEDKVVEAAYNSTSKKYEVSAKNTLHVGEVEAEKIWIDDNNRDDGEQSVTLELHRKYTVGTDVVDQLISTKVLSSSNKWTYKWTGLPVRTNLADGLDDMSQYYVVEVGASGGNYTGKNNVPYKVTYSAEDGVKIVDETVPVKVSVTNGHDIYLGSLTANKTWEGDALNKFGTRPVTITLTLQYYNVNSEADDKWETVSARPALNDDSVAFMGADGVTYSNPVTLNVNGETQTYTWGGLPVNYNGQMIQYRVLETVTALGYTAEYPTDPATLTKNGDIFVATVPINNKMDSTSLTIKKTWENTDSYLVADYVLFRVEYRHGSTGTWTVLPDGVVDGVTGGIVKVQRESGKNTGSITIGNLPMEANDKTYEYRVSEVSVHFSDGTPSGLTVNAVGNFDSNGTGTTWNSTAGIYQSEIKISFNETDKSFTASAENDVMKGDLTVTKKWVDDDDRDNGRKTITVQLYRDGAAFGDPVELKADDWTFTFEDLPVYKNDAAAKEDANKSVYYVRELDKDGDPIIDGTDGVVFVGLNNVEYATEYKDLSGQKLTQGGEVSTEITNIHDNYAGTVMVEKSWVDQNNAFNTRPAYLTYELQYKDPETFEWIKVPVKGSNEYAALTDVVAYTGSANPVMASVSAGYKANWTDVPVNYEGTPITYRVVETAVNAYTSVCVPSEFTLVKSEDVYTNTVTITNTLKTVSLNITKNWEDDRKEFEEEYTPTSVTFKVEYFDGSEWKPIPDGLFTGVTGGLVTVKRGNTYTDTSVTLTNLPYADSSVKQDGSLNIYKYRVSEYNVNYSGSVYAASGSFGTGSDDTTWTGTVGDFDNVTRISYNADTETFEAAAYNTLILGSLTVNKSWADDSDRDGGRQSIKVALYADSEPTGQTATLIKDAIGNYQYTFSNLPVYNKAGVKIEYAVYELDADDKPVAQNGTYTGANNGAENVMYLVTYSNDVKLVKDALTPAAFRITNTHDIFLGSLSVVKSWEDNGNAMGTRPGEITYILQYSLDGETWSEANDAIAYTELGTDSTITVDKDDDYAYTWTGMPVNYQGKAIKYRVYEKPVSGYKPFVSDAVTLQKDATTKLYSADVEAVNEPQATEILLTKVWDDVSYLQPVSANFKVEYRHGTGSDWTELPEGGNVSAGGIVTVEYNDDPDECFVKIADLPMTDSEGNDYEYRVSETSVTIFNGTEYVSVMVEDAENGFTDDEINWSGFASIYAGEIKVTYDEQNNIFKAEAENTAIVGDLSVSKIWNDGENRDGGREIITVQLYRDGKAFMAPVDLSEQNGWTNGWTDLPVYQEAASHTKSVYYVREMGEENMTYTGENDRIYAVSYSANLELAEDDEVEASVINTHDMLSFDLRAFKLWNDNTNEYDLRPEAVDVKLQWSVDPEDEESWQDVPTMDIPDPADDTGDYVFTTSETIQTLDNTMTDSDDNNTWAYAQWNDLPGYVLAEGSENRASGSTVVYYRVVETGEMTEAYTAVASRAVTIDEQDGDLPVSVNVVNTLENVTFLTVTKNFEDEIEPAYDRPDSITVRLQYTDLPEEEEPTEADWKFIDTPAGTVLLTADSLIPWSYTWLGLRDDYRYRAIETAVAYGDNVIETEFDENGLISGIVGNYVYGMELIEDEEGNLTQCILTNTIRVGELEVIKTWSDNDDREGLRPKTLTFSLYRDGGLDPYMVKTVAVTEDGIESCVFEDLPLCKDGSTEFSEYYVTEESLEDYMVTYELTDEETATFEETEKITTKIENEHELKLFAIDAIKIWDDNEDPYGIRPSSVDLKLQYALTANADEWFDVTVVEEIPADETTVFTTSELIQTLTQEDTIDGSTWGTALWEDLPAFITNEEGTFLVYYKVTEDEAASPAYGVIDSDPFSYEDAEEAADLKVSGIVTDPLIDAAKLEVSKTFVDNNFNALKMFMPESVTVQLQYRETNADEWAIVPMNAEAILNEANEWKAAFTDLRGDYEYRCVEISMDAKGKSYEMVTNDKGETTIWKFIPTSENKTVENEDGTVIYFYYLTNALEDNAGAPDTGDHNRSGLYIGAAGASVIGMTACLFHKKKEDEEEDAEEA